MEFKRQHTTKTMAPRRGSSSPAQFTVRGGSDEDFRFGIEEEYFICDAETLEVASETPDALFEAAHAGHSGGIDREFLQAQMEVATLPHTDVGDARTELVRLRQTAAAAAGKHGYAIMACGTHPTAQWPDSVQTRKDQYRPVAECLQMIGRRNMLCGMHVHVEFRDPRRRVDAMRRLLPYVPLFLALSTSSPFWRGTDTGLKGYRLAAYDELPRTGLPELFRTSDEYEAYVSALVRSGAIENSSRLWWTVRPSHKYPTLELRAPDCCPRLEDAVAIASLYRAVVRALYYDPERNADLDAVGRAIAVENKWRAQRNGVHGTFVTEIGGMSVEDVLGQLIEQVAPHAAALGCLDEVEHCRTIVSRGTGADAQLEIFRARGQSSPAEALQPVKRWIAETTAAT